MAQYLKTEVEQRILDAARAEFAARGFAEASVARIAKLAGVSTGNVYRYFESKDVLFREVVPEALARRLLAMLRARVRTLVAAEDDPSAAAGGAEREAAELLLAFSIRHRLEVVILLSRAEGTIHERFAEQVKLLLMRLATAHFRGAETGRVAQATEDVLALIYDQWVRAMVAILREHADAQAIRSRVDRYAAYHLAGLAALFSADRAPRSRQVG